MAEISLRAYIEYLEDRLARDAFAEVMAQCRHILETYPKHVDSYRLLARAVAAQENYTDALDLFQRVLSAEPNDFVSHIGMSECYREDGALDQAIWHLERAFEQAPSNTDIQNEVKKLYEMRDGHAPLKIQMTGGALARMYVKGKLYDQAISELTKALTSDPERLDLQVTLAEALWNSHQEVAAARVAAEVLKKLPYSLEANRLLTRLWQKAGQPGEARPFIERVRELDPYEGYSLEHRGENAPADSFRLTMLEFTTEAHVSQIGAADWVSEIKGIEKQKGVTGPLKESQPITDIFGGTPAPAAPAANIPGEMPTPDWLQDALGLQGATVPTPTTPAPGSEKTPAGQPAAPTDANAPEWLKDVLGEQPGQPAPPSKPVPAADASTPDWLKDALLDTPVQPAAGQGAPPGAVDSSAPGWLQDALQGIPAEPPTTQPAPTASQPPAADAGAGAPEWLKDVLSEQTPTTLPASGSPERQKPAWLDEVLSEATPAPAPAAPPPSGPKVVSTDMLNKILTEGTPVLSDQAVESAPVPTAAEKKEIKLEEMGELETWDGPLPEIPAVSPPPADWLTQDTGLGPAKVEETASEPGPLPEWLTAAPPTTDLSPKAAEPEPEPGEMPDWLKTDTPIAKQEDKQPAHEGAKDELPDWLKGEAAPAPPPASALQEEKTVPPMDQPPSDAGSEEEVPDWLASGDLDSDDALKWLEEIAAKVDPNFKMEGTGEAAPAAEAAAPTPATPKVEEKEEAEAVPDWLKAEATPAEPAKAQAPAEDLDWLRAPTEAKKEKEEEGKEELPDWLKPEAEKPAAKEVAPAAEDALAWLDQEIKKQGVSPDQPVSEALKADHPPMAAPMPVPDLDAEAAPVGGDELPDWLKEAGGQQEISKALEGPAAEAEMAELPELPVEADELAWLNDALKAEEREATPAELEELFGGAEVKEAEAKPEAEKEEAEELPDWLKAEEAPAAPKEKPTPAPPPRPAPLPAAKVEEKPGEAEELPDWLKGEMEPQATPGGSGLTEFLQAVEPAAPAKPEPEAPLPPTPAAAAPPPAPAPAPMPTPTPVSAVPAGEADAQLKAARDQMAAGELQAALGVYEGLVAGGQKYDDVIKDLTEITKTRVVVNPKVYRVIGDALNAKGNAQEALDYYRKALDSF